MNSISTTDDPGVASHALFGDSLDWTVRMYFTRGSRADRMPICIYIAPEKDWTARAMEQGGHGFGTLLASAPATQEAAEYRAQSHRSRCLQYSGSGNQGASGLAEDLATLGYDEETIERFVRAAAPRWPVASAPNAKGQPHLPAQTDD